MQLELVIFDMDGTIVLDEGIYKLAFLKVLDNKFHKKIGDLELIGGIGVKKEWEILSKEFKIETKNLDELVLLTEEEYLRRIDKIKESPGFKEFVEELKDKGIHIALATSSSWKITDAILNKLGWENLFDAITIIEEVTEPKPDPEIFLLSANKIGVEPDMCMVIEDSQAGIEAAKAAGMQAVGITNGDINKELKDVDLAINHFDEIEIGVK